MSVGQKYELELKTLTTDNAGVGRELNVIDMDAMSIQLAAVGSATGTIQFEGSIDGTNFFSLGVALTAPGAFNVPFNKLTKVRAKTTANIAGGTYAATLGGFMRGE